MVDVTHSTIGEKRYEILADGTVVGIAAVEDHYVHHFQPKDSAVRCFLAPRLGDIKGHVKRMLDGDFSEPGYPDGNPGYPDLPRDGDRQWQENRPKVLAKLKSESRWAEAAEPEAERERRGMPRLQDIYRETVRPALAAQFGYTNPMQVPALEKIVLNMGVGEAVGDSKKIEAAVSDLAAISGQKPVVSRARKSIAGFKLREGMAIGCKVTLRRTRMWEFFDRLTTIALPRVRDFRGVSPRAFDGRGNYSLGVREQIVFPEISYDRVDAIRGMNIVICTTARTDEEARALLGGLNMPFER